MFMKYLRTISAVLASAFAVSSIAGCSLFQSQPDTPPGKLPLPQEERETPSRTLAELQQIITSLNPLIGSYPVSFTSSQQQEEIYQTWADAYTDATSYMRSVGNAERVLWTAAELARQGHNMDVDNAGFVASGAIEKCLKLFPRSVMCHRSAVDYYSSIRPTNESLRELERSLNFLRARLAPKTDESIEEKYVSLYAEKGQKAAAVKQIDRLLKLYPRNKNRSDLLRFRAELQGRKLQG
jgi:hypothetical protein